MIRTRLFSVNAVLAFLFSDLLVGVVHHPDTDYCAYSLSACPAELIAYRERAEMLSSLGAMGALFAAFTLSALVFLALSGKALRKPAESIRPA